MQCTFVKTGKGVFKTSQNLEQSPCGENILYKVILLWHNVCKSIQICFLIFIKWKVTHLELIRTSHFLLRNTGCLKAGYWNLIWYKSKLLPPWYGCNISSFNYKTWFRSSTLSMTQIVHRVWNIKKTDFRFKVKPIWFDQNYL